MVQIILKKLLILLEVQEHNNGEKKTLYVLLMMFDVMENNALHTTYQITRLNSFVLIFGIMII